MAKMVLEKEKFFEEVLGVTDLEVEKTLSLALSRGGDFAEAYYEFRINDSIFLEEGMIKNSTKTITQGVGVRTVAGEKTGFACSDDLKFKKVAKAAVSAAYIANANPPGQSISLEPRSVPHDLYNIPKPIVEERVSKKLKLVREADKVARKYDSRIKEVRVSLANEYKLILIANSEGLFIRDAQPLSRLNVVCIARDNGNQQVGTHGGGGRIGLDFFKDHKPSYFAKEAARQAITQLEAVEAPAGVMEVVLAAGWQGVLLHEAVGHGLEADFNRKKFSAYAGRIGERVASELCTVIDDGTIPYRRGSTNIDDEGTVTQRTVLIEKGILKGYISDRLSARLMKIQPTGNGRREDFAHIPIPRMTNTFLLAGDAAPEEILKSVNWGLYVANIAGGQVDITNGKFVFSVSEGYLIENGKIGRPVKGATLIGNGPEVLTKVTMVGDDLKLDEGVGTCGKDGQSVPVGVGTPTVKISEMTVGGTSKQ